MSADGPDVGDVIRRFRAAGLNASGESAEKTDCVRSLEGRLGDPPVRDFLASVLESESEYDLARVEICKALLVSRTGPASHRYAVALLEVLKAQGDILVRQWAARALGVFAGQPSVASALVDAVTDAREDPDVRHNALESLRAAPMNATLWSSLEGCASDPDVGGAIQALLRDVSR